MSRVVELQAHTGDIMIPGLSLLIYQKIIAISS